jgi:hypothetical protein
MTTTPDQPDRQPTSSEPLQPCGRMSSLPPRPAGTLMPMSGGYEDTYRTTPSPGGRGRPAATRLAAAALLVLMAVLAVGASFEAFIEFSFPDTVDPGQMTTGRTNGWWSTVDGEPDRPEGWVPQDGTSLLLGGILAVASAIMLIVTARRADDPAAPRLTGVGSAAFLLGIIVSIWHRLVATFGQDALYRGPVDVDNGPGVGAWMLLLTAAVALAVIGLLILPRRRPAAGIPATAYSSGYGAPTQYPGGHGRPAAIRLVAAALLVLMAVLGVGASFEAFIEFKIPSVTEPGQITTGSTNGWGTTVDGRPDLSDRSVQQDGTLLVLGALLAVASAIMLVVTARRADDSAAARLVGIGSAAFLLGIIVTIWHGLISFLRLEALHPGPGDNGLGVGAWILLLTAVVALAVIGLLILPRRRPAGGIPAPPHGSGYGAPTHYPPPTVTPPGWGSPNTPQHGWVGLPPSSPSPGGPQPDSQAPS